MCATKTDGNALTQTTLVSYFIWLLNYREIRHQNELHFDKNKINQARASASGTQNQTRD